MPIRDVQTGDKRPGDGRPPEGRPFDVARRLVDGRQAGLHPQNPHRAHRYGDGNHPLLTAQGWRRLDELYPGDIIATAMRLPEHGQEMPERADLCRLLGYLIGDGTFQTHRADRLLRLRPRRRRGCLEIVAKHFPQSYLAREKALRRLPGRRLSAASTKTATASLMATHCANGCASLGILGQKDSTKQVPDWVWEAGQVGASQFLAGYFSADGCVKQTVGRGWFVQFDTVSRRLAEDVQLLLLRLGVIATVNDGYQSAKGDTADLPGLGRWLRG